MPVPDSPSEPIVSTKYAPSQALRRRTVSSHKLRSLYVGCGETGSTLLGPLQKYFNFCQIGEKGTPWHFWEDKSRLT